MADDREGRHRLDPTYLHEADDAAFDTLRAMAATAANSTPNRPSRM